MGNTTIQSEQIADDAITTGKIADQGTDGQVLTSTGSGVAWEDAAGGGVDGISSAATSNAIHIDSASRVSFGTTSPFTATVAQVYQSDNTTYSGNGFSYQVGDGGLVVQNNSTTTNSMAGISFVNGTNTTTGSGTAAYGMWNNYSIQTSSSGKSDLVWTTKTPGGTVFEAMRLIGNGVFSNPRLGIGTNSPTATLDVDGDINADGDVDAENYKINGSQGSDGQVLTSTGSGVAWEDAAGGVDGISSAATGNAMHIDSSGRIGFGTTNPSAWQYYNDLVLESGNPKAAIVIAGTSASGGQSLLLFSDGSGAGQSGYAGFISYTHNQNSGGTGPSLTNDWMAIGTNGQHRIRIDNAGNVGIGNDYSPSDKLDVNGTIRATNYKIGSDQGSDGQVLTSTGSGVAWEDVSGGLPPNIAGLSSGRYYTGMLDTTGSSNFTLPTTYLNYYPFIVPEDCTIDELTVIINGGTGNSGDVAQIAVYGPMPANVGSTPHKITSSTFAVNSGYGKSVAITATTFTAGIYFFAMAANTSSLTVRAFQDMEQHIPYMVGVNNYSFNGGLQGNQYAINTVSTWPHSFPTSISVTAATHSLPARPQFKYGVQ